MKNIRTNWNGRNGSVVDLSGVPIANIDVVVKVVSFVWDEVNGSVNPIRDIVRRQALLKVNQK